MNYQCLEQNIRGMIEEQQLKLGYEQEIVRLYYPLHSLNNMLETNLSFDEMKALLDDFCASVEERYGRIMISAGKDERFCVAIPPEGGAYVQKHLHENPFLKELIDAVREHGVTMEEILNIFRKYSSCVVVEELRNGEFDYLVYFEDGNPDDYRYCFHEEMHHIIYHRYSKSDYEDFGF